MKMPKFILVLFFLLATLAVQGALTVSPGGSDSNSVYSIAIVAANSVGGPTNGVTAATAASIAATNATYAINTTTNALTRTVTNQWSRGSGRYYGPVILDTGLPVPENNGYGSVDLQSTNVFGGTLSLNSAGGVNCFIGGGSGNLIYQSQTGYDANGFTTATAAILSGESNLVVDCQSVIAGGGGNYAGPRTLGELGPDDGFLGGGTGNYLFATDSVLVGGIQNTNESANSFLGGGSGNWLYEGLFIGACYSSVVSNASYIVAGQSQFALNSPYGGIVGGRNSKLLNAQDAHIFGNLITNSEPRSIKFGWATNAWNVNSNGVMSQTKVGGGEFVSISAFGGITNNVGNNIAWEIGPTNGTGGGSPLLRMIESSTFNESRLEAGELRFDFFGTPSLTMNGSAGNIDAVGAISAASFSGDGAGLTAVKAQSLNIGSNSVAFSGNISIYLTNVDGTVYRLSAQRIVP